MYKTNLVAALFAVIFDTAAKATDGLYTPELARGFLGHLDGIDDLIASCTDPLDVAAVFYALGVAACTGECPVEVGGAPSDVEPSEEPPADIHAAPDPPAEDTVDAPATETAGGPVAEEGAQSESADATAGTGEESPPEVKGEEG